MIFTSSDHEFFGMYVDENTAMLLCVYLVTELKELPCCTAKGHSQTCLKDASFGSQYITHSFQPEDEIHSCCEDAGESQPIPVGSDPSSFQPQYGSIPTKDG